MGHLEELWRVFEWQRGTRERDKTYISERANMDTAFAVMHYVEYNQQLSGRCTIAKIYIKEMHGLHW